MQRPRPVCPVNHTTTQRTPLHVEIVLHIVKCCFIEDQAALAQVGNWLSNIASHVVYQTIRKTKDPSILFWPPSVATPALFRKSTALIDLFTPPPATPMAPFSPSSIETFTGGDTYSSDFGYLTSTPRTLHSLFFWSRGMIYTLLHLAVFNGHLDTVRFLLDRGLNIEAPVEAW